MNVITHLDGYVGYVELNNPPVNAIGQSMRQGLLDAVFWAEAEGLDRVILSGRGRAFAAGADAREFDSPLEEPHLPDVVNAIEKSFIPWIAAIDGVALGGGAELAMACRMRIMAPTAQIGLPEVTLGVIPGAGGTQRLGRLVGLRHALDMMTSGKPISAQAAFETRLIHAVESDPVEAAYLVNSEVLGCIVPTWELPSPDADTTLLAELRERIAQRSPNQIAPQRAIDIVELGLTMPFNLALVEERKVFIELRNSHQARALRHLFFAERQARQAIKEISSAPGGSPDKPIVLEQVAVVGGGTMGAGIAYALLNAGLRVIVLETDDEDVKRALCNVERIVQKSLDRGIINASEAQARRKRLTVTADYAQASNASLAIEAAFESMSVKRDVFARLESELPIDAVLATNTSYLDVNEIAASVTDSSRVIGMHFFAPAHVMKLLEIVRGDVTGESALATAAALAGRLHKVPVVAGVCDGFIGNRILARYREAADTVLMDGSTPWEIDAAMVEFGYAMGPYEAQDLSGLDIAHANRRRQDATRDPERRYIPIADRMVELGKLGRKTGAGWYRYPGGDGKVEDPIVADLALEEARFAGIARCDYTAAEIRERLLMAMINEAADILHEGIAHRASDIDLVTVFGYGFPRWRGGLMHYANTLGPNTIIENLSRFCEEDPVAWKISPALHRYARTGVFDNR